MNSHNHLKALLDAITAVGRIVYTPGHSLDPARDIRLLKEKWGTPEVSTAFGQINRHPVNFFVSGFSEMSLMIKTRKEFLSESESHADALRAVSLADVIEGEFGNHNSFILFSALMILSERVHERLSGDKGPFVPDSDLEMMEEAIAQSQTLYKKWKTYEREYDKRKESRDEA